MTPAHLKEQCARLMPAVETYEEGAAFAKGFDAAAAYIMATLNALPSAALRHELQEYMLNETKKGEKR